MILNPFIYQSGGGGSGPILLVTVTGATATSVTAVNGGQSVSLSYDSTAGKWWAVLPSTGTWTVTATNSGGNTKSVTVSAASVTIYETSMYLSVLPGGFVELEYLQSIGKYGNGTGVTIVDTSALEPPNGIRIVGDISLDDYRGTSGTNIGVVLGGYYEPATNGVTVGITQGVGEISVDAGTLNGSSWPVHMSTPYTLQTRIGIEISTIIGNTFFKVNGNTVGTSSDTSVRGSNNAIGIFGRAVLGNNPRFQSQSPSHIYGPLSFYTTSDDSGMISKIYPAKRSSDNALGFYDVVTQNFYVPSTNSQYLVGGPEIA